MGFKERKDGVSRVEESRNSGAVGKKTKLKGRKKMI